MPVLRREYDVIRCANVQQVLQAEEAGRAGSLRAGADVWLRERRDRKTRLLCQERF